MSYEAIYVRIISGFNQAIREVFGYDSFRKETMSLELGSIGTAIGNVASGIGGGVSSPEFSAPAFGVAPLVGGISAASFCEGPMPVNSVGVFEPISTSLEGLEPMGKLDLGTLDLNGGSYQPGFSLGGEILFNDPLQGADFVEPPASGVIAEVESFLAAGRAESLSSASGVEEINNPVIIEPEINIPEALVVPEPGQYLVEPLVYPKLPAWEVIAPQDVSVMEPLLSPAVNVKTKTVIEEAEAVTQTEQLVNSLEEEAPVVLPAVSGEAVEEIAEEEKAEEEKKPQEVLEEEENIEKEFYLEDEQASGQRKHEIKEAIIKARVEADRLGLKKIAGWLVAKFLPGEHEGNRSQVVKKKGPDGSYQETIEVISGAGELESEEQAIARFNAVVEDKKPVKRGKEGKRVGLQVVARVFKFHIVKPSQPQSEVVKRVVKKKVQQPKQDLVSVSAKAEKSKAELNIAHFPKLAEVFEPTA